MSDIWDFIMRQMASGTSSPGSAASSIPSDPAAEVRADVAADPTGMGTPAPTAPTPAYAKPATWQAMANVGTALSRMGPQSQAMGSRGSVAPMAQAHQGQPVSLIDLVFGVPRKRSATGGY